MRGAAGAPEDPPRGQAYWPSAEEELLLRAALGEGADALAAWQAAQPVIERGDLPRRAEQLLPLIGANLRRLGADEPMVSRLLETRDRIAARNRGLLEGGRRVLETLTSAGIDTMVLKGAALAASRIYPGDGLRPMSDVDVVVPHNRAAAALSALAHDGWTPRGGVSASFIDMQHGVDLFAGDGVTRCDLHWHVYWECCQPDADVSLWDASVPRALAGIATRALGPADQLLHICIHGSRRARRPRLFWVADALLLMRAGRIDWPRLAAEARQRAFALRTRTMLQYLREAFDAAVPDGVLADLDAVPVGGLERTEYRVGLRSQGILGELPSYWCNYRRLRPAADWRPRSASPATCSRSGACPRSAPPGGPPSTAPAGDSGRPCSDRPVRPLAEPDRS